MNGTIDSRVKPRSEFAYATFDTNTNPTHFDGNKVDPSKKSTKDSRMLDKDERELKRKDWQVLFFLACFVAGCNVNMPEWFPYGNRVYDLKVDLFDSDDARMHFFVILLRFGAGLGIMIGASFADRLGRAFVIEVAAIGSIAGWLFIAFAPGMVAVLWGRWFTGFSLGALSIVMPVYIVESADPRFRGFAVACYCVAASWMSQSMMIVLSKWMSWRSLSRTILFVPCLLLLAMEYLPDSPVWLVLHLGERAISWKVFRNARGIRTDLKATEAMILLANQYSGAYRLTMHMHHFCVCLCLLIIQAMATSLLDVNYSCITSDCRIGTLYSLQYEISPGFFDNPSTWISAAGFLVCSLAVDTFGGRNLLCFGSGAIVLFLALQYTIIERNTALDVQTFLVVEFLQSISLHVVPLLYTAEVFPSRYRLVTMGCILLLVQFFRTFLHYALIDWQVFIDQPGDDRNQHYVQTILVTYSVPCLEGLHITAFLVAQFAMIETHQRTLEELEIPT